MTQQKKDPNQTSKAPQPPQADAAAKEAQREKAEVREVAGRHKNDGQKGHKGRI